MTDVRALLHDLSADAPTGHGAATADRVVAVHRAQDRRRRGWAAVAAAVALVVGGTPALLDVIRPTDSPAVASGGPSVDVGGLYDLPTRGSLADDDAVVQQALRASWETGFPSNSGRVLDPDPDSRRVLFAGEVSGDQVWTLVMGLTGRQLAVAWFVDVDPDDGLELLLAGGPMRTFADTPVGLVDVASGGVVVVSSPGDEVTYAPENPQDGDGADPVFVDLPTQDGIAVGSVPVAVRPSASPGFQVVRDDVVVVEQMPLGFDSTGRLGAYDTGTWSPMAAPDVAFGPRMTECLTARGLGASVDADGALIPPSDPEVLPYAQGGYDACAAELGYR